MKRAAAPERGEWVEESRVRSLAAAVIIRAFADAARGEWAMKRENPEKRAESKRNKRDAADFLFGTSPRWAESRSLWFAAAGMAVPPDAVIARTIASWHKGGVKSIHNMLTETVKEGTE